MKDSRNHESTTRTECCAPTSFGESGAEPGVGFGMRFGIFEPKKGATRSGNPQPQCEGRGKRVHHPCKLSLRLHA